MRYQSWAEPVDHGGHIKSIAARFGETMEAARLAHEEYMASPEYKAYHDNLDTARKLWMDVQVNRNMLRDFTQRLREPDVGPTEAARTERIIARVRGDLIKADATAREFGVDPEAEFPKDEQFAAYMMRRFPKAGLPDWKDVTWKPNRDLNQDRELNQEDNRVPLHSAVERAVGDLKQAKGTGEQMLAQIARTPGVKPEEMKWLGLDEWLRGQKSVTKEQIAEYVRANKLDVREVRKGGEPEPVDAEGTPQGWGHVGGGDQTKYQRYKLPGGDNYRELLITLPREQVQDEAGNYIGSREGYRTSHWAEPNVLAHVRFDERTAPDGKKVLMVHEVQSDWHQTGRKEGYQQPLAPEDEARAAEFQSDPGAPVINGGHDNGD